MLLNMSIMSISLPKLVTSLFAAEVRFFHLSLTSEVVLFATATAFTAAFISAQNFIVLGVCHTVCEFGL